MNTDPQDHLLLPFDTDQAEFARGFEAGRLWALLRAQEDEKVEEIVHATNAEMALRMAEATERDTFSVEVDDTWIKISFGPAGSRNWLDV